MSLTEVFFEPDHKWPSKKKAEALLDKFSTLYEAKFSGNTFSLAAAALSRIGALNSSDMSSEARNGMSIVYHGKFVGPDPAKRAAAFLELLERKLPQTD
jgi:hypothetical protein